MRILRHIRTFARCSQGMAAVEFALSLPILMTMFLSGFEITRYLLIHQKVEKASYTVTDVVTQSQSITNSQLQQIVVAATQLMLPYTFGSNGIVIVSSVYKDGAAATPKVLWRYTGGGTLARTSQIGAVNADATLPSGFTLNDKDNIIIAEVYYRFTPFFLTSVVPATDVYKTTIFKPRLGALTTTPT